MVTSDIVPKKEKSIKFSLPNIGTQRSREIQYTEAQFWCHSNDANEFVLQSLFLTLSSL